MYLPGISTPAPTPGVRLAAHDHLGVELLLKAPRGSFLLVRERLAAHVKTAQRQLGRRSAEIPLNQYGHLFVSDLDDVAATMRTATGRGQNVVTEPRQA